MRLSIKPRLQRKHIAFFTIVPFLVATALIEAGCPVCDGQGFVSGTPAMEEVKIVHIESEEKAITRDVCSWYTLYNYDVILSLENRGPEAARGWVKMVLIDFIDGQPLDNQYTVVEVPGQTSLDVSFNIWFSTGLDEERRTEVQALIILGKVPCLACNETGQISLNSWPVVNALKDTFQETGREEKPFYAPPVGWAGRELEDEEN